MQRPEYPDRPYQVPNPEEGDLRDQEDPIANRGDRRPHRALCAEMGIRSVAVLPEADRHALHVKRADEAHSIGADPGWLLNRAPW